MKYHDISLHQRLRYKCNICSKAFSTRRYLSSHEKSHGEEEVEKEIKCDICERHFTSQKSYMKHLKLSHDPNLLKKDCLECGKCFKSESHLKQHWKMFHETEFKHKCNLCGKSLKSARSLRLHLKISHEKIRIFCDICNKDFSLGHIDAHKKSHSDKIYKCDHCDTNFRNKRSIKSHIARFHSGNIRQKFDCDLCNVKLSEKANLNRHKKLVHTDSSQVSCEKCSKVFSSDDSLKRHIDHVHNKIRHQCNICNKTFSAIRAHQKLHQHKKIKYPIKSNLKKFTCAYCSKEWQTKTLLRNHIKVVHEESQKTSCPNCDKIFVCNVTALSRHMEQIHEKIRFECDICCKSFCRTSALKTHYKKIHEIKN